MSAIRQRLITRPPAATTALLKSASVSLARASTDLKTSSISSRIRSSSAIEEISVAIISRSSAWTRSCGPQGRISLNVANTSRQGANPIPRFSFWDHRRHNDAILFSACASGTNKYIVGSVSCSSPSSSSSSMSSSPGIFLIAFMKF